MLPLWLGEVDQGCGHARPCAQANFDGNHRILVRLGRALQANSSADVRSVELPQHRQQRFLNWQLPGRWTC